MLSSSFLTKVSIIERANSAPLIPAGASSKVFNLGLITYSNKAKVQILRVSKNVIVNIRRSRGKDIDAACGQLANKNELAN